MAKKRWSYVLFVVCACVVLVNITWIGNELFWLDRPKIINSHFLNMDLDSNDRSSVQNLQGFYLPTIYNPSKLVSKNSSYNYRDLRSSRQVPWTYDKRFKNPCWYDDGALRCLPYFFIIGVTKCGTTSLYGTLMRHPEMMSTGLKESQFFGWQSSRNDHHSESIEKYIDTWSNISQEIDRQNAPPTVNKLIFCDASPEYIYLNENWKKMPGNTDPDEPTYVVLDYIHAMLPNAKLIVSFRDPVERFYSEYIFACTAIKRKANKRIKPSPSPEQFHTFAQQEIRLFKQCLQSFSLRSCAYKPRLSTYTEIRLSTGLYHVYWEELLRVFPRNQIHVVHMTDISNEETARNLFEFLELSPASDEVYQTIAGIGRKNTRPESAQLLGPMLNETRRLLHDFYRPYNERMAALTGDKVFLYPMD